MPMVEVGLLGNEALRIALPRTRMPMAEVGLLDNEVLSSALP
jgi:hypothetical protein